MRERVFFFHYNKPESKRKGKNQISIHYKDKCHIVDNLEVKVPTFGHSNKRQPYFVMKGKCKDLIIEGNKAVII